MKRLGVALTALASAAVLTAAGTASASTAGVRMEAAAPAATQCASGANPVWIQNSDPNGAGDYVFPPGGGSDRYTQNNTGSPAEFCPVKVSPAVNGIYYYYYFEVNPSNDLCLTANVNNNQAYAATCTVFPASQQWHYYGSGNTLVNRDAGDCLWFAGQPPKPGDFVNIGGPDCTKNQNDVITQISVG